MTLCVTVKIPHDSHDFVGRDVLEELWQLGVDPVENEVLVISQQFILKKETRRSPAHIVIIRVLATQRLNLKFDSRL